MTTVPIYEANGNTLTEGSTGVRLVPITTGGVLSENTSQVYAIKNPLAFIYNTVSPWDWYTNTGNHDDVLWGDGNVKSEYDPCPHGWKVPTNSELTYGDFSTFTMTASGSGTNVANGRIYNNIAWFPAAGYRYGVSGVLNVVGNSGYYWSASVSDTYAKYLRIFMSNVYPNYTSNRAYSFSVRCVQE